MTNNRHHLSSFPSLPPPTRHFSVRSFRHVHDMVREHHDQPGPDVSEWRSCGEHRVGSQRAELPTRAWPVPPLHTQRPLDRHQHDLRRSHSHPSQETAQRFDQGERRSGTYYYYYINRLMASFISFPFALRKSNRMHQAARGNDAISPDLQGEGR